MRARRETCFKKLYSQSAFVVSSQREVRGDIYNEVTVFVNDNVVTIHLHLFNDADSKDPESGPNWPAVCENLVCHDIFQRYVAKCD
jgi:hypothetical protein